MYCGDETGAFVGDISSYSSCFGYAGDDCPKSVLASYMYKDGTIPTSLHRCLPSRSSSSSTSSSGGGGGISSSGRNKQSSASSITSDVQTSMNEKLSSFQEGNDNNKNFNDLVPIYSPYPKYNRNNWDALNPDNYLENDGLIQNYDAYENVWMKAFHDLNVRHLGKHYHGYGGAGDGSNNNTSVMNKRVKIRRLHSNLDDKNNDQSANTTNSISGSGVSSTNLNHSKVETYDDSLDVDDQVLIHPLLAVDSGHTDFTFDDINNHNSSSAASTSLKNKQRCKIMEILFESLSAPAAFIAPSPMVSSFAFGRQTSLIVDIGARGMRVTPIVDGLLLENAQRRSGRGGEWLNSVQHHVLNEFYLHEKLMKKKKRLKKGDDDDGSGSGHSSTSHVHPRYACQRAKDGSAVKIHYPYTDVQKSIFHDLALRDVMYEMKTSPHISGVALYRDDDWTVPFLHLKKELADGQKVKSSSQKDSDEKDSKGEGSKDMEVDETEENEGTANVYVSDDDDDPNEDYDTKSKKVYSLPDGTRVNVEKTQTGKNLCRLAELLFAEELPFSNISKSSTSAEVNRPSTFSSLPIHQLIKSSLSAVADADVRKELCGNIILTGASSLFPNLQQRLSLEISHLVPNMYRCKVICSRNTLERRYSPWIGSSVLSSLGSFQQLWLSRSEYTEYGGILASQRFP